MPRIARIEGGADEVYTLIDDRGRAVASVRGASIRVGAFATEDAAVRAALRGDRVISAQLDSGRPSSRPERPADVGLMHAGAYEWVVRDRRPVARLIRPGAPIAHGGSLPATRASCSGRPDDSPARHTGFALEFVVPTAVSVTTRVRIAQALHRAFAARTGAGASRRALDETAGADPTDPTPPAAA
jgi:hypothetical protein